MEALNVHQDTLVAKAAGSERRLECDLAHHPGVRDCHLGLDQVARVTQKATAMTLLRQYGSKKAHLTRRMRAAMRAPRVGSDVDDYYLGLDVDADGDDAEGSDRRPECELVNHPVVMACHLGLSQLARETLKAKTMELLGSNGLTQNMRAALTKHMASLEASQHLPGAGGPGGVNGATA